MERGFQDVQQRANDLFDKQQGRFDRLDQKIEQHRAQNADRSRLTAAQNEEQLKLLREIRDNQLANKDLPTEKAQLAKLKEDLDSSPQACTREAFLLDQVATWTITVFNRNVADFNVH